MTAQLILDEAVGETRACLTDDQGAPIALAFERWSDWAGRAIVGEVHSGRVIEVNGPLNAAFVEMAKGKAGFLPFGKKGRPKGLHEGAWVAVQVIREAMAEKGPNLRLLEDRDTDGQLALLEPAPSLIERMGVSDKVQIRSADRDGRDFVDAAVEEALATTLPIPGGGDVAFEPTRAMLSVDVDTGNNPLGAGKVNLAAARLIFRQMRLRSLGGIVAIDFAGMKVRNERAALEAQLSKLARQDPERVDVLPLSRFGIVELIRRRSGASVAEIMLNANGQPRTETRALTALRALENEAKANRGKKLILWAGGDVFQWLKNDGIGWMDAMTNRIGPRFLVQGGSDDWKIEVQ